MTPKPAHINDHFRRRMSREAKLAVVGLVAYTVVVFIGGIFLGLNLQGM